MSKNGNPYIIKEKKGRFFVYILKMISYILVIVGALNWGLVGFFGFDLVAGIFGEMSILARIVYGLVGIGAIISLLTCREHIDHHDNY